SANNGDDPRKRTYANGRSASSQRRSANGARRSPENPSDRALPAVASGTCVRPRRTPACRSTCMPRASRRPPRLASDERPPLLLLQHAHLRAQEERQTVNLILHLAKEDAIVASRHIDGADDRFAVDLRLVFFPGTLAEIALVGVSDPEARL